MTSRKRSGSGSTKRPKEKVRPEHWISRAPPSKICALLD